MKISLDWQGGVAFRAETPGGHKIVMDGPLAHGGKNLGPRPMEAFLSAAAACSAFDVVHILKKSGQNLSSLSATAEAERSEKEPKVFTRVNLRFVVGGENLRPAAVERAVSLSAEKHCSALRMLAASCPVSASWEIKTE